VIAAWPLGAGLSAIRATVAKVERVLLYLLARLGIDHELAYRYPAVVAGVGPLALAVVLLSRWVRGYARLAGVHRGSTFLWAAPPGD